MKNDYAPIFMVVGVLVILLVLGFSVKQYREQAKLAADRDMARAACKRLADSFDARTTESGAYIKYQDSNESALGHEDPWGNNLKIIYSKGGMAEILKVCSFGPDGVGGTKDDIVEERMSANLSGVGSGIKNNIGETAKEGTRGIIDGIKEGLFKKKDKE